MSADCDALQRVILAACAYIHGSSSEQQDRYTDWRETYKSVFGVYPPYAHTRAALNDGSKT